METKKPMTNAKKLLSDGLQEQATQLERNDAQDIANELKISARLVRMYLKGDVFDVETGKAIVKTARNIILTREKSIKKLVA